jgi:hypothetical protein
MLISTAFAIAIVVVTSTATTTRVLVMASTITAFTADPTCNSPPLSMLLNQGNRVWINYPYPASALTSSGCYPPDLLKSLETPFATPPTSSLSCPDWYTTITRYTGGYAVCCPT